MTSNVKRIQVNGLNFAVTDQGDAGATAVVLLHGFPNNKNMWGKQVGSPELERSHPLRSVGLASMHTRVVTIARNTPPKLSQCSTCRFPHC